MHEDIRIDIARQRFVVLHYHIFKNGGSTLESVLRRNFGAACVDVHGRRDDDALHADDLLALLRERDDIRAVCSHHLRYPRPAAPGFVFFDACFLRHPFARIRSLYHYGRKLDPAHGLGVLAHAGDEAAFVAHLIDAFPHMLCDVQVHFIANASAFTRPAGPRDIDVALAALEAMALPGVVELFDQSLVAAEYFLRPAFPELQLDYVARNVSSPVGHDPAASVDALMEDCRAAWGARAFEQAMALNAYDLRLYAAARDEVLRRFDRVPDNARRLAAFRARCRARADSEG